MKHLILAISACIICMSYNSLLASELIQVSRVDNGDIVQLYFSFDRAPAFSETVNERRIDPYIADFEFRNLEKKISLTNPLSPYLHLSLIETALATSQYARMNKLLLQDDIAFPEKIELIDQGSF